MGKLTVQEAMAEAAEVRSWTCETCPEPSLDGSKYCRSCGIYWADVRNGLFDDDWRDDLCPALQGDGHG